ncbi:PP2C family protein-serine/threonine phosphatase [Streptomyces bambusae]|uniref:SpoIIE family protein phosphatase n=1 Tax=Streptomyces bambusae TaxID=1550616 RepID=A0ABS6Z5B2_9ACTN|nr:PP2C family protein-serine/threonine phosphatase [Streptomyces bambusae]MBW5482965.1 SpoIIE family protein phosphatase [Streptomyces bambusae]
MLDIAPRLRVDVDPLMAAQHDLGVCNAFWRITPGGKVEAMSAPHLPKVAGIDPVVAGSPQTAAPVPARALPAAPPPAASGTLIQDRLAGMVSDLTTLHELTERLARAADLDSSLRELLRAGAALVGARRGLVVLEPTDGLGPAVTIGLGLGHADLGHIETVPRSATSYGRILDGLPDAHGGSEFLPEPDAVPGAGGYAAPVDPRHREVAARLGYAASYSLPLTAEATGRLGAAVWLYDEPAEPGDRQRDLIGLYVRHAAEHLARMLEVARARTRLAALSEELLPSRLPRVPGVQLAARHHTGPHGGGDWYDALPLPEGALGLAVGSVTGSGPGAVAAMGRMRASLRAYAVMEGEDPVAVLSDLELLLRLTEPARSATALFAYCEPAQRKILLAGAGHAPPLVVGDRRTEYVETSLSAPLGMLSCWEAPSVEIEPAAGETVLLYTDGLLRRTGDSMDRAYARLHAAAAGVPRSVREDPGALVDHVLHALLPDGPAAASAPAGPDGPDGLRGLGLGGLGLGGPDGLGGVPYEDIVLLAARFD